MLLLTILDLHLAPELYRLVLEFGFPCLVFWEFGKIHKIEKYNNDGKKGDFSLPSVFS